jgi:hypothetical protein
MRWNVGIALWCIESIGPYIEGFDRGCVQATHPPVGLFLEIAGFH